MPAAKNPASPEVEIIGSGTGIPSRKRGSPSILVRAEGEILLLDTGPCTLQRLLTRDITYMDIDKIFYTHFHPDHCSDFVFILFTMRHALPRRQKPLWVFGPPGLKELYDIHLRMHNEVVRAREYDLNLMELWEGEAIFNGWKVKASPLVHFVPDVGYRLEFSNGKSLVYSGDTEYCKNIVELARDADLLILECSFPEDLRMMNHLVPSLCGRIARESGCRRLLLTHFYPQWEGRDILKECRKFYSGELVLAEDNTQVVL